MFCAYAPLVKPELFEALEERRGKYAIDLPAHDCLERDTPDLLSGPPGQPRSRPAVRNKSFLHQAVSWTEVRRMAANGEYHCGELLPRAGFIVTNLETDSPSGGAVLRQAQHGRAVGQGRQAGGEDDAR